MVTKEKPTYTPDYAIPPGETILEVLETRKITQTELAERLGRPKKTINEIIHGKAAITPGTALQLERALGIPARIWNNLEREYRDALARIAEHEELTRGIGLLRQVPLKELLGRGFIKETKDKLEQLRQVLVFFGVGSVDGWLNVYAEPQASFRPARTLESKPGAVAAWMRVGEVLAAEVLSKPYDKVGFEAALKRIRKLTSGNFRTAVKDAQSLCAEVGVAFVVVPEFKGTRLCGLTRWVRETPTIQLSRRYGTDDQFWFTFFHEAGHILLHGRGQMFMDDGKTNADNDEKEAEANAFAANALIPAGVYGKFVKAGRFASRDVGLLATKQDIAPGIIVGRLQRDGLIGYTDCPGLKVAIKDISLT
jgi:HTH-type transcriptional regulator/antitoxin HigA